MTIAAIDIGTNTVLLLVAEVNPKDLTIEPILNREIIPRIGESLKLGGYISREKQKTLIEILASYKNLAEELNCNKIIVLATNALRIASNQNQVVEEIEKTIGLRVNVISGIEEARLTFLGCTYNFNNQENVVVMDIGGGSTEIILGNKSSIEKSISLPIGAVSLTEEFLNTRGILPDQLTKCREMITNLLKDSISHYNSFDKAIAVAGTPTTLACIQQGLTFYDESKIEGAILNFSEINYFIKLLSDMTIDQIQKKYKDVVYGREDVLLAGAVILQNIMKHFNIHSVVVSSKGVRYGAVYDYLLKNSRD